MIPIPQSNPGCQSHFMESLCFCWISPWGFVSMLGSISFHRACCLHDIASMESGEAVCLSPVLSARNKGYYSKDTTWLASTIPICDFSLGLCYSLWSAWSVWPTISHTLHFHQLLRKLHTVNTTLICSVDWLLKAGVQRRAHLEGSYK